MVVTRLEGIIVPPNTETGRRGEFLAAYILESYGIECHHVNRQGADLWCLVHDRVVTVEVKAASQPAKDGRNAKTGRVRHYNHYQFFTGKKTADFFCFVALDRQVLLVKPAALIVSATTRISVPEFNEANQRRTIEEMINP